MRWKYEENGIMRDVRNDKRLPHEDHMEMSGQKVSLIVRYGVKKDGSLILLRRLVWPMLRTIPNNTHASFMVDADSSRLPELTADGKKSW